MDHCASASALDATHCYVRAALCAYLSACLVPLCVCLCVLPLLSLTPHTHHVTTATTATTSNRYVDMCMHDPLLPASSSSRCAGRGSTEMRVFSHAAAVNTAQSSSGQATISAGAGASAGDDDDDDDDDEPSGSGSGYIDKDVQIKLISEGVMFSGLLLLFLFLIAIV